MKIAVDAMGGDHAPRAVVEGAVWAARELGVEIVLVGETGAVEAELKRQPRAGLNIRLEHAPEWITMEEKAALTVRKKRKASINVAVELMKRRQVDALVSAGNTGAVVCSATLGVGLLENVERPGIAIAYPTLKGVSVMLDVGANVEIKSSHLVQYAVMGDIYSRHILGKKKPRIGLLSVGEEETKGNAAYREAFNLLRQTGLNFIGNIEGNHLFLGESDVVVTDGFVGNVVLKVSEGLVETLSELLRRKLKLSLRAKIGALLSMPAFKSLKKELSHAEFGGAPLLGIDGICIIAHGASSNLAIKNAIKVASEFVRHQVNQRIVQALKKS